ncbi:hypothetical protein AB0M43_34985 [Longispora sp. NPDC051575]|uniref:hypothetical protein n=1 Tax=Longispora sp. NPDC051575 TaxID=3154943 RepID=UPI003436DD88
MSGVLLVTADQELRGQVDLCARRAGTHVTVHADVDDALDDWNGAELVLLGADRLTEALDYVLPKADRVNVVAPLSLLTTAPLDPEVSEEEAASLPWKAAEEIGATYVAVLPVATAWLTGQLAAVNDHPVQALLRAGFRVGYADPADAEEFGYLSSTDLYEVSYAYRGAVCPFVSLEDVARDECAYGQSSLTERSNYRSLRRDHKDTFTDLSYTNVNGLGAWVSDLSPDLVDTLIGLKEQYPLYDESDHSDLEHDEIHASWSSWVSSDLYSHLGERAQDVWVALSAERLEELWWEVVRGLDAWPEHDGLHVGWDLDRLAGPFAARLMAEFRRTFRPAPAFTISVLPTGKRPGPRYAVIAEGFPLLLALAWSRFSAKVDLWRYQNSWRADTGQVGA